MKKIYIFTNIAPHYLVFVENITKKENNEFIFSMAKIKNQT